MNHKRFRRLYREEKLQVRQRGARKRALGVRAPLALPNGPNERWSLDFVSDCFTDGRRFRILAIVDDFTRESLALIPDTSLSGARVARELDALIARRGRPKSCVSDNGTELTSMAILKWTETSGCRLALHRAGQAAAERLCRELHRPAARRVLERDAVRIVGPSPRRPRCLAHRLQRRASAFGARQQDTGGVPSPAHCRCGWRRQRSKLQPRTLLLIGWKKGLRSPLNPRCVSDLRQEMGGCTRSNSTATAANCTRLAMRS